MVWCGIAGMMRGGMMGRGGPPPGMRGPPPGMMRGQGLYMLDIC